MGIVGKRGKLDREGKTERGGWHGDDLSLNQQFISSAQMH